MPGLVIQRPQPTGARPSRTPAKPAPAVANRAAAPTNKSFVNVPPARASSTNAPSKALAPQAASKPSTRPSAPVAGNSGVKGPATVARQPPHATTKPAPPAAHQQAGSTTGPARSSGSPKVSSPPKINTVSGGPVPLPAVPAHEDLAQLQIDQHAAHIAAHQAAATMHTEHCLTKIGAVVNAAQNVAKNPTSLGQITSIASLVASAATVAGVPGAAKAAQAVAKADAVTNQIGQMVKPTNAAPAPAVTESAPPPETALAPAVTESAPQPDATLVPAVTQSDAQSAALSNGETAPADTNPIPAQTAQDTSQPPANEPAPESVPTVGGSMAEVANQLHEDAAPPTVEPNGVAPVDAPTSAPAPPATASAAPAGVAPPALDGANGSGAGTADTYDGAPALGTWQIDELTDDEKHATATAGTEDDLYHINIQDESHIERLEDHSGLPHDVAIVTPRCTFLAHMSRLGAIPYFKGIQEVAVSPAFYQFAVIGPQPYQLKPLTSYTTEDTRHWDDMDEDVQKIIRDELHLLLRIAYGHRPAIKSWAQLDETYTIMNDFSLGLPLINEVVNAGLIADSPTLGEDLVTYPAAFLNLGWQIKNRKIFLEALAQVCGRLVYHGETAKTDGSAFAVVQAAYPTLADAAPVVTKYAQALHARITHLVQLMSAYMMPSIVDSFSASSKKTAFKKAQDPTPIMIRPDLTLGALITAMKDYRDYMSCELGRNGRGGGYTTISGRDAEGAHKKFDWFTELPIAEDGAEEGEPGVPFEEFNSDFAAFV